MRVQIVKSSDTVKESKFEMPLLERDIFLKSWQFSIPLRLKSDEEPLRARRERITGSKRVAK